jgi:hypothetical protein
LYLLLGDAEDPCCRGVQSLLDARHLPTRVIQNPFEAPSRLTLRLRGGHCLSELKFDVESEIVGEHISGVLVRNTGRLDPQGWQSADFHYMCAETSAALLAWLWSLPCPVVNRYPSLLWFQPRFALLFWHSLMHQCGLPTLDVLVTNVECTARAYRERLACDGIAGAVYGPLTSAAQFLVSRDEEWGGLSTMQRYTPVCLQALHGATQLVCLIGEEVVWEPSRPAHAVQLETGLRRFIAALGLVFAQFAVASTPRGNCVVAFDPFPSIERFGATAQQRILDALVDLLTTDYRHVMSPTRMAEGEVA